MTLGDLKLRHSVRNFSDKPISESHCERVKSIITEINTHEAGVRFELITNDSTPFKSFMKSYGIFRNANNYISCMIDKDFPDALERAGFYGQKIVMESFFTGLSSCFVSGTYNPKKIASYIRTAEKLIFIIVLGYEADSKPSLTASITQKISHRNKKLPMQFLRTDIPWETCVKNFPELKQGLEAVACAPSAHNRQPVEIKIYNLNNPILTASVPQGKDDNLIDLGIAMYNFQIAVPGFWQWGNPAIFTAE